MDIKRILSAVILGLLTLLAPAQYGVAGVTSRAWYVSASGSNGDGQSWSTAWTNLDAIQWANISAGDTVYLDGGASSMVYTGTLTPRSGVTVALSQEAGRNGQTVFFGGRTIPLPNCDTASYTLPAAPLFGIDMSNAVGVTIDGTKWRGIVIHGYNRHGVKFSSSASNDTVRYVEIYDNGTAFFNTPSGAWRPDQPGVYASGSGITLDHDLIHDNGQDALQSGGGVSNWTISNSWLYNSRPSPTNPSLAYNYCMHSDGFQIYNGGAQSGVNFQSDILGPGLMQGTLLGQALSNNEQATINNVTINNVLVLDATNANLMDYAQTNPANWTLSHVTSFHVLYDPDGNGHTNVTLNGTNQSINDSILYGGSCYFPHSIQTSGDYRFNAPSCNFGTNADPLFKAAPPYNSQPSIQDLIAGDYSLLPGSPATGKGSALTSVAMLLGSAPASTPTPTWTPVVAPTLTPTYAPTSSPTDTQTTSPTDTPIATPTGTSSPTQSPTITPTSTETSTPTETVTNVPTPVVRQVLCTVTTYPGGRVTIDCP